MWLARIAVCGLFGCASQRADTADPDMALMDGPMTLQAEDDAPEQTEVGFDYASKERGEADRADDREEDEDEPEAKAELLTPERARALVEDALSHLTDGQKARFVTPALPSAWPSNRPEVVYLVYPLEPLPRGVTQYRAASPSHRVTLSLVDRTVRAEPLPPGKSLGEFELGRPRFDDPIEGAETALFEVVAGKVDAERRRYILHRYQAWFDAHPTIAADLRGRIGEFSAFVARP